MGSMFIIPNAKHCFIIAKPGRVVKRGSPPVLSSKNQSLPGEGEAGWEARRREGSEVDREARGREKAGRGRHERRGGKGERRGRQGEVASGHPEGNALAQPPILIWPSLPAWTTSCSGALTQHYSRWAVNITG